MSNFQPLEVAGRGSDPQLQVGENLYKLRMRVKLVEALERILVQVT